jgi:hypothetical protein
VYRGWQRVKNSRAIQCTEAGMEGLIKDICAKHEEKRTWNVYNICYFAHPGDRGHGPMCRFAGARLLRLRVWIPPMARIFVSCVYRVLCIGSGFCDELITHSGGLTWCVCLTVCELGTLTMRWLDARFGLLSRIKNYFSTFTIKNFGTFQRNCKITKYIRLHETPFGRSGFVYDSW